MYLASLYPDRIIVRYEHPKKSVTEQWADRLCKIEKPEYANLTGKRTSFGLSYQTRRKIRDTVSLLGQLSKPRTVYANKTKPIYNFRTNFITLTLPSKQVHPDQEIKGCLNNFLTTLRTVYGLKNYIWKAELQKNENIHFHLITDIFIPHQAIRYYWNKAVNVLGYVDRYQQIYQNLTLKEYAELRQIETFKALNGYQFGNKTNWKSPPTENVKNISNLSQLSYYVSKYVSKDFATEEDTTPEQLARIENFGRVWGRSQSLSAIKFTTRYNWDALKDFLKSLDREMKSFTTVVHDYHTALYINFESLNLNVKNWLKRKIYELGITYQYPFPHLRNSEILAD